jgi:hypothetical protein
LIEKYSNERRTLSWITFFPPLFFSLDESDPSSDSDSFFSVSVRFEAVSASRSCLRFFLAVSTSSICDSICANSLAAFSSFRFFFAINAKAKDSSSSLSSESEDDDESSYP